MGKSNIVKALSQLKARDTMSMVLFALYKIHDDPEYAVLSELGYILDGENLSNLLDYYGGMTIKVPTKQELSKVANALLLYQYTEMDGIEFDEALKALDKPKSETKEIKDLYQRLLKCIEAYDFERDPK